MSPNELALCADEPMRSSREVRYVHDLLAHLLARKLPIELHDDDRTCLMASLSALSWVLRLTDSMAFTDELRRLRATLHEMGYVARKKAP